MDITTNINELIKLRNELNKQIVECNAYLRKRGDMGQTHRPDDIMETISFTRGKSIGLIIARDRINKIIKETQNKTS